MKASALVRKIIDVQPKIAVVGDYIEDRYVMAEVTRISPEAPVIVARAVEKRTSHGGAGNVWATLRNLGVDAYLFCNGDPKKFEAKSDDESNELPNQRIFASPGNYSIKTRIMSGNHHLLRVDDEADSKDLEWPIFQNLSWSEEFKKMILDKEFTCVVISDYGKGVVSKHVAEMVIALCQDTGTPCIVDAKGDFNRFENATIIKCNQKESNSVKDIWDALRGLQLHSWIVTQGENGIDAYVNSSQVKAPIRVNGINVPMIDVCGAGDTVTAILAVCMVVDPSVEEACSLANFAAAETCKHPGVYVLSQEELMKYDG